MKRGHILSKIMGLNEPLKVLDAPVRAHPQSYFIMPAVNKKSKHILKIRKTNQMLLPMLKVIIGNFPTSQANIYEFSGHSLFANALLFLHHDVTGNRGE